MHANKTELTQRITATVCHWLFNRGFELIEAENSYSSDKISKPCRLCKYGYREDCWQCGGTGREHTYFLADISAFGTPSRTQLKACGLKIFDSAQLIIEYPVCALVEVKQSRADFRRDLDLKFTTTYAHLNYIAYPLGLLKPSELPDGWFGIEMCKDGDRVYRLRREKGVLQEPDTTTIKNWVASISLRRYNRDTYQWWQDLQRELSKQETSRSTINKLTNIIEAVSAKIECSDECLPSRFRISIAERISRMVSKAMLHPQLMQAAKELDKRLENTSQKETKI